MTNNAETLRSAGIIRFTNSDTEGTIELIEPTQTIKCILDWMKDMPDAMATFSYSNEYGWSFTVFADKEES